MLELFALVLLFVGIVLLAKSCKHTKTSKSAQENFLFGIGMVFCGFGILSASMIATSAWTIACALYFLFVGKLYRK